MTEILDVFTNAVSGGALGGLLGVVGVWLKGREERETLKIRGQQEIELRKLTYQEIKLEADTKLKLAADENQTKREVALTEAEMQKELAAADLQKASYDNDKSTYSGNWVTGLLRGFWGGLAGFLLVLVDVVRGMVRPASAIYLMAAETVIAWMTYELLLKMNGLSLLQPEQVLALMTQVVATISAAFMMVVAWYFGSRPTNQRGGA